MRTSIPATITGSPENNVTTAIAFGCSLFNPLQDKTIKEVFDRADDIMYHRKAMMKNL